MFTLIKRKKLSNKEKNEIARKVRERYVPISKKERNNLNEFFGINSTENSDIETLITRSISKAQNAIDKRNGYFIPVFNVEMS